MRGAAPRRIGTQDHRRYPALVLTWPSDPEDSHKAGVQSRALTTSTSLTMRFHFAQSGARRPIDESSNRSFFRAGLSMVALVLWLVITAPATAQTSSRGKTSAVDTVALLDEARTFMESYARDLRTGDRAAIAARYDRAGVFRVGMGQKSLQSRAQIAAEYAASTWHPPTSFAWRDISYEVLGPEAVLVVGQFDWGLQPPQPAIRFSYTAVLRRREGGLRIRLEDESADPMSLPSAAAQRPAPKQGP